jgi:hypothetical protein
MRHLAAALLLAAVPAAGCATAGSGSGSGGPSSLPTSALPTSALPTSALPTSALPTSALPTSALPTSALPTPPPEPTGTLTLTGVVERGVEPGCLVLRASGKSYTLLGGSGSSPATGVPLSVPVTVVGSVATGMASYCQQGTLLKVVRVSRS